MTWKAADDSSSRQPASMLVTALCFLLLPCFRSLLLLDDIPAARCPAATFPCYHTCSASFWSDLQLPLRSLAPIGQHTSSLQ